MNDDDLATRLDHSFGDGPAHRPLAQTLARGRRRLLRRRLASGAAVAAVVGVLATTSAVVAGGSPPTAGVDPAAPTTSSTPSTSDATTVEGLFVDPTSPATAEPSTPGRPTNGADIELAEDGTLLLARGVRVTETVEDPLSSVLPARSVGVTYTLRGETYWGLAEYAPDGGYVSWDPAGKSYDTLQQWLDAMVALQAGEPGVDLVRFDADPDSERLRPRPGVEVLDQTGDVELQDFAGPQDRTAAAMVRFEGERWFVLARELDGVPDYLPVTGEVGGRDLDAFLAYATDQYAGGEGLR